MLDIDGIMMDIRNKGETHHRQLQDLSMMMIKQRKIK